MSLSLIVLAASWPFDATPAPTASPTPTPAVPPGGGLHLSSTAAVVFVAVIGLTVGLLWLIPTMFDLVSTSCRRKKERERLEIILERLTEGDDAHARAASKEQVNRLIAAMREPPRGMQGLTRGLLALVVVTLLAVALAAVLASDAGDSGDLRKSIVTSLTTVFATIAGFYFGSRTAQSSAEQSGATKPRHDPPGGNGDGDGSDKPATRKSAPEKPAPDKPVEDPPS